MGYVKLLGLPQVILWTPLIVDLIIKRRSNALPIWPMWIITFMIVIIGISLTFDHVDSHLHFLRNAPPLIMHIPK